MYYYNSRAYKKNKQFELSNQSRNTLTTHFPATSVQKITSWYASAVTRAQLRERSYAYETSIVGSRLTYNINMFTWADSEDFVKP